MRQVQPEVEHGEDNEQDDKEHEPAACQLAGQLMQRQRQGGAQPGALPEAAAVAVVAGEDAVTRQRRAEFGSELCSNDGG